MTVISLLLVLVVIPAVVGFCLYTEHLEGGVNSIAGTFWQNLARRAVRSQLEPGDFLIYRKAKVSPRPGRRAQNVHPAENGDDYYYDVDKFWTVSDVLDDGRLVAVTRTGKQLHLRPEDDRLRKPALLERMRYRRRFPSL